MSYELWAMSCRPEGVTKPLEGQLNVEPCRVRGRRGMKASVALTETFSFTKASCFVSFFSALCDGGRLKVQSSQHKNPKL